MKTVIPTSEPDRQLWLIEQGVANAVTLGATDDQIRDAAARGIEQGRRLAEVIARTQRAA